MNHLHGVFNFNTPIGDGALAVFASTDIGSMWVGGLNPQRIITAIHVPRQHRGQGHGSRLLDAACELADQYRVDLFADPRGFDASPLDHVDLMCWYERRDFHMLGGIYRRSFKP